MTFSYVLVGCFDWYLNKFGINLKQASFLLIFCAGMYFMFTGEEKISTIEQAKDNNEKILDNNQMIELQDNKSDSSAADDEEEKKIEQDEKKSHFFKKRKINKKLFN